MRRFGGYPSAIGVLFLWSITLLVGCGDRPPERSEFTGEVVTELPEVPGAEERYPLPKLEGTLSESEEEKEVSH